MKKLELLIIHKTIGIVLILTGIISYIFPVPGSTPLVILGFIWLIGKKRSLFFLKKIFGEKMFKLLKIKNVTKSI